MKKAAKTVGAVVTSLGIVVGLGGFAGATSGTIGTTGPWSYNQFELDEHNNVEIDNDNDLDVTTRNDQDAKSGDADVKFNTHGGDAESGSAHNSNRTDVSGSVSNGNGGFGSLDWFGNGSHDVNIDTTGPNSRNVVDIDTRNNLEVRNNNNIDVYTNNDQYARSGDANVSFNTFGGSARTGDASNTNDTSVRLDVSN